MIKQPKMRKNNGFSLFELMMVLSIFGAILLTTNYYLNDAGTKSGINTASDLIKSQENIATKYINENYDKIYKQLLTTGPQIYKINNLPDFQNFSKIEFYPYYFAETCLLLEDDKTNQKINAKLIFPNLGKKSDFFNLKNIKEITYSLGYSKNIDSKEPLLINNMALINSKCANILPNSIMVDLNKSQNYSNSRIINTDNSNNLNSTNETLKSTDSNITNKTMGTNLYFDAIVKESTPWSTDYCDGTKAQITYASKVHDSCVAYATSHSTYLDGVEKIINGGLVGSKCEYTTQANFSGYFTSSSIGGYSQAEINANGQPFIDAGCQYNSTHGSTSNATQICILGWNTSERLTPNRGCRYGNTYSCMTGGVSRNFDICADDTNGNQTYINQGCSKIQGPWQNGTSHSGLCTQQEISWGDNYNLFIDSVLCKIGGSTSTPSVCGKILTDPYNESGITPPQHKFKGLSFGNQGSGNVIIKSGTSDGVTTESDVYLNVQSAGVKSGYVIIKSKAFAADSYCNSSQIGKIVQQQNDTNLYTASALVCTYDPDFCGGNGYCLSPLKSQSMVVTNQTPQNQTICPAGLRIDPLYIPTIANGYLNNATCAATYSGGTNPQLKQGIITDQGKSYGIKSTCTYSNGANYGLNNIQKIRCTSAEQTKTFNNCVGSANGTINCNN